MKSAGFPGPTAIIAELETVDRRTPEPRSGARMQPTAQAVGDKWVSRKPEGAKEKLLDLTRGPHATARKLFRNRTNVAPSAAIPATQTASVVFTTHPGATPTRRSRNGRKFHVVM